MTCPECNSEMVKPTGVAGGGLPRQGMLCTNPKCPVAEPCACGHGWVAVEVDPRVNWPKSVGTMQRVMEPGDRFIVCPNEHRTLTKAAPPHVTKEQALAELMEP